MPSPPTVLIFTFPEYGQANVQLAASYELALAGANVYISSFASLEPRVTQLQELIARPREGAHSNARPTGSVSFCECTGLLSFAESVTKQGVTIDDVTHSHGVLGALKSYTYMDIFSLPWNAEEHLVGIESMKKLIAMLKPDVVVIDLFFYVAMDACELAGQNFVILLPNSIKDVAMKHQPKLAALWKYPCISSGFPYPLKWWQIPFNVFLLFYLIIKMAMSTRVRQIQAFRQSLGVKAVLPYRFYPGVKHICPGLPETDFPLDVVPEEMVCCGPIILPFETVEQRDPTLKAWLDNGPTVMVNLGSHVVSDEKIAKEMASAFRILLDYHGGKGRIQILWKVKPNGNIQQVIDDVIGKEIIEGKVRMVPWLEVEPVSVLQHQNVVCTVHHGGANSFFEGVWSGVPHVVLPVWWDTFDYANRAEFLNIGLFGSKTSAPSVRAEELGEALVRVTRDTEEARGFRSSAQRLKGVCRAKGEGRKLASEAILRAAGFAE